MALDQIVEEGMAEAKVRPVKLERIVVGVDFGEASIAAATWAARSFAPGAQIVLVHSIHVPEPPAFLAGLYPQTDRVIETAQTGAQQRLRDLGTSIATGLVWTEVRIGKPEVVLAAVAAEYGADLIDIGRRTVRPGIRDRLGSTPERVLRQSPIPLLLAAPQHEGAPRHLLAAIDGSVATESALGWTDHLVARYGATATLVHVVAPLAHLSEDTALAAHPHGGAPVGELDRGHLGPLTPRSYRHPLCGARRRRRRAERPGSSGPVGGGYRTSLRVLYNWTRDPGLPARRPRVCPSWTA